MKFVFFSLIPLVLFMRDVAYADDHSDAKYVCQKFALKQLKAPATAQFEPLEAAAATPSTDKKWKKMKDVWDSMSWVDSQNSFGALIRSEFMCTVQKAPDGRWKLLDLYWFKNPQ